MIDYPSKKKKKGSSHLREVPGLAAHLQQLLKPLHLVLGILPTSILAYDHHTHLLLFVRLLCVIQPDPGGTLLLCRELYLGMWAVAGDLEFPCHS